MLSYIKDGKDSWTVVCAGKIQHFDTTHQNYEKLVQSLKDQDEQGFIDNIDTGTHIQNWSEGSFVFKDGILTKDGGQVNQVITDYIISNIREGFDKAPILRFLERLDMNPSKRACDELFTFMMNKHLPITPDGYLLCYKAVTGDYKDKWTNSIDNSIGATPNMPRNKVCDDADQACGPGLHAGAVEYATGYAGSEDKLVIVKVDPANVVSVPKDSSCQKMRTCGYEVVGEFSAPFQKSVVDFPKNVENELDNDDEDEYNDEDEWDDDEIEIDEEDF